MKTNAAAHPPRADLSSPSPVSLNSELKMLQIDMDTKKNIKTINKLHFMSIYKKMNKAINTINEYQKYLKHLQGVAEKARVLKSRKTSRRG